MFQFHGECRRKFGMELGEQVWEEINRCFDAMPICKNPSFFMLRIFDIGFSIQVLLLIIVFYVFMVVYHR